MNDAAIVLSPIVLVFIMIPTTMLGLLAIIIFRMQSSTHRSAMTNTANNCESWRQIASEAVGRLENAANEHREARGLAPFKVVAPVEPEHSSPIQPWQQQDADLATMRARVVAAALELGQDPKRPPTE